MKYLPISELDNVNDALNFETGDCRVVGACDVYITKAVGGDKKLYKSIETTLESQHEAALRYSASLSPPEAELAANSLNLSRSSPFGPLSQISSRRTFAYLIATLNASHPDYDFSQFLRPSDFRREKNLKKIMDTVNTNLFAMRPKHLSSATSGGPGTKWALVKSELPEDAPPTPRGVGGAVGGTGNTTWSYDMWQHINKEMGLRECIMYSYEPEEDPYNDDEDEGLPLWSFHYFFFNKAKKRVCYLYMRAFSLADDGSYNGGLTPRTPVVATGRTIDLSWAREQPSSAKRASYWLGSRAVGSVIGGWDDEEDDEDDGGEMTEGIADDTGNESDVRMLTAAEDSDAPSPTKSKKLGDVKIVYDLTRSSNSPSPELQRQRRSSRLKARGPVTRSRSRGLDEDVAGMIEL